MLHALLLLQAAAACPATPAPLPPELAGWPVRGSALAAPKVDGTLTTGRAARAVLRPAPLVRLAVPAGRPPAAGEANFAELFSFDARVAGRYRVALGAPAWIDVVRDGKALPSVAHAHGPACSGVRKTVDYDLQTGRYRLQIVGSATPAITVMVMKLP